MKKHPLCATALLMCLIHILPLQGQIMKFHELERFEKNPDLAPLRNGDIVDINSTLRLHLNKEALAAEARQFTGTPAVDLAQMRQLKKVLQNELKMMQLLSTPSPDEPDLEGLYDLAEIMDEYFNEIATSPELRQFYNEASGKYDIEYPRERRRALVAAGETVPSREEFILMGFSQMASELAEQLTNDLPEGSVRFLLSGRLRSPKGERLIKLSDEFDTFQGEFYSVPRWEIALSEEGKRELMGISFLTDSLNQMLQGGTKNIGGLLGSKLKSGECLKSLFSVMERLDQTVDEIIPATGDLIKETLARPKAIVSNLINSYSNLGRSDNSRANLLFSFNDDLKRAIDSIGNLVTVMDDELLGVLEPLSAKDNLVQQVFSTYESCRDNIEADKKNLGLLIQLFRGAQKITDASETIGDEVRRLPIDRVPDVSYIDLKFSGYRENGDQLVIKAILEKEEKGQPASKIMEQIFLSIQQIGVYSIIKPMLLLADPLSSNANIDLKNRFQFAPSYSLLFKWGSRKSKAFNQFWSPALGINFAAPDFNTDGVPEFGAAFEFSLLRDYLAGGLGYNFGADASFYFIGFRLPIGAVPLPIFNDLDTSQY